MADEPTAVEAASLNEIRLEYGHIRILWTTYIFRSAITSTSIIWSSLLALALTFNLADLAVELIITAGVTVVMCTLMLAHAKYTKVGNGISKPSAVDGRGWTLT